MKSIFVYIEEDLVSRTYLFFASYILVVLHVHARAHVHTHTVVVESMNEIMNYARQRHRLVGHFSPQAPWVIAHAVMGENRA